MFIITLRCETWSVYINLKTRTAMKQNVKMSIHFTPKEVFAKNTRSEILDVLCSPYIIANMEIILSILDDLRAQLNMPIKITSFYRDIGHNARVGGSPKSKHLVGAAVDITCADFDTLHRIVMNSNRKSWKYLPYLDRHFIHIQLNNPYTNE